MNRPMRKDKPFAIPRQLVWEAYRRVAANKGAAGRRDGLRWPHCDGLKWPHPPSGFLFFDLYRITRPRVVTSFVLPGACCARARA
jgi:hypothetical protein